MARYTYDPRQIGEQGKDAMRFQLGDTQVEGGAATAFLSDEEIEAVIQINKTNWKQAKISLIEAVCRRLAFETDWSDDGTSFRLSQRADRWKQMLEEAKREMVAPIPMPGSIKDSMAAPDGGHYFYGGMQQSPYTDKGDKKL